MNTTAHRASGHIINGRTTRSKDGRRSRLRCRILAGLLAAAIPTARAQTPPIGADSAALLKLAARERARRAIKTADTSTDDARSRALKYSADAVGGRRRAATRSRKRTCGTPPAASTTATSLPTRPPPPRPNPSLPRGKRSCAARVPETPSPRGGRASSSPTCTRSAIPRERNGRLRCSSTKPQAPGTLPPTRSARWLHLGSWRGLGRQGGRACAAPAPAGRLGGPRRRHPDRARRRYRSERPGAAAVPSRSGHGRTRARHVPRGLGAELRHRKAPRARERTGLHRRERGRARGARCRRLARGIHASRRDTHASGFSVLLVPRETR